MVLVLGMAFVTETIAVEGRKASTNGITNSLVRDRHRLKALQSTYDVISLNMAQTEAQCEPHSHKFHAVVPSRLWNI